MLRHLRSSPHHHQRQLRYSTTALSSSITAVASSPLLSVALCFFSTPDPVKQRRMKTYCFNAMNQNPHRGRDKLSYDYERRIKLFGVDSRQSIAWPIRSDIVGGVVDDDASVSSSSQQQQPFDPTRMVLADVVTPEELEARQLTRPHPLPLFGYVDGTKLDVDQEVFRMNHETTRRLQRQADTAVLKLPMLSSSSSKTDNNNNDSNTNNNGKVIVAHVIQVLEPDVRPVHFLKMEAQIELITAFRNILMEFFEIACPSGDPRISPDIHVVRIPALSLSLHNGKFDLDIEKMHHQSLIQAFHRCSLDVKDWFALHSHLSVELYVPRPMLPNFERAFAEEAWETPKSALVPPRPNMYIGMQMPESLLENAPGFIGEREEIKAMALPYEERQERLKEIAAEERRKSMLELEEGDDGVYVMTKSAAEEESARSDATEGDGDGPTIVMKKGSKDNIF